MKRFLDLKENKDQALKLIIFAVLAVGILVRCYKFGILMDATQSDEMGTAYDAWALIHFGTDRYGKSWPVYFNNYGVHGQSALMTYLSLISFKIFGYGKVALRLPALFVSALAGIFGTLVVGETTGKNRYYQIVFAILYGIAPYTIMASRFALDCNLMFGIATVFLYFLIVAYKTEKMPLYFVAGLFAGLTLYTYSISYIVMPLMLVFSLIYMCYTKKISLTNAVVFTIPLAILAIPLILVQVINMFDLEEFKIGVITIIRINNYGGGDVGLSGFFIGIVQGLLVSLGFDDILYNTDPRFFTFYPMSIIFFVIGLVLVAKRTAKAIKEKSADPEVFISIWFLCEMLAAGLMIDPNVNRMNGILFAVMYGITIGAMWLIEKKGKVAAYAMAVIYGVYFVFFLFMYYTEIVYADVTTSSMCPEAFEYINASDELKDREIATNIPPFLAAASVLPNPELIDEEGNYRGENYVCYTYTDYETLRDYFYNRGGTADVYLIYRPQEDDLALFEEMGARCERFGLSFYLYYWE